MNSLLSGRVAGVLAAVMVSGSVQALPVIPGAAGFGIETPAGRGGTVYRVTSLAASGAGTLDACVRASGPRVCVFEVSGTIQLSADLIAFNPYLTIAGQTAPAPGIMIRGAAFGIATSDVLVQHIAFRVGDSTVGPQPSTRDSLQILSGYSPLIQNIVVDHCSVSWGVDENLEVWDKYDNVSLLNNIIAEPLHTPAVYTEGLAYNNLIGISAGRVSFIGNLFAHGWARNPSSAAAGFVFVNNVIYNSGQEALDLRNYDRSSKNSIAGNVFLRGPSSGATSPAIRLYSGQVYAASEIYLQGNEGYQPNGAPITSDQWTLVSNESTVSRSDLEVTSPPIWPTGLTVLSAANNGVLNHVLAHAGTRPANRNTVDAKVISHVTNRTGAIINCVAPDGSSRCQLNAGGWPTMAQNYRALTLPANPSADDDRDGYTNLEEWLHAMAAEVEGSSVTKPAAPENVIVQ